MKSTKQVVVFRLGDIQFGFPIEDVNEIVGYTTPTNMPNTHGYLEGIISLRGKIHAVINLRQFFGMDKQEVDGNTKIIIANSGNVGFVIDDVNMIVTPKAEEVEATTELPAYIDKSYVDYILKIERELAFVLNMVNVLSISIEN